MNTYLSSTTKSPVRVDALRQLFADRHRFSKGLVERGQTAFGPHWADDFEGVLESLFDGDDLLSSAAKGYTAFAFDSLRRQRQFEGTREYPHKTYAEAAGEVYFNQQHMEQEYLPGLLLSHYLWPHHYRQIEFFDTAFLSPFARAADLKFAEVGIGTALYSRRTLERVPEATGEGYDISPSSCSFAERHVAAIGAADRYEVRCQDILQHPMAPVSWLICVEVLEHLEDPVTFLRGLRSALRPGGKAFITAAVNAAHADHIYLYRDAGAVWKHLEAAGFTIEQSFAATAFAAPGPGVPVPVAAAFVVTAS
jgi:SAM-dependent methyltransferase